MLSVMLNSKGIMAISLKFVLTTSVCFASVVKIAALKYTKF